MVHGENLTLSLNGTIVAAAKSCNLKFEQSLIEVASPVSGADTMYIPSKRGWSISTDGLCVTMEYMDSLLWKQSNKFSVAFFDADLKMVFRGDCYIKSMAISGSIGKIATYSIDLQGCGALSKDIIQKLSLVKGGYDIVWTNGLISYESVNRTSNIRQFSLDKGRYFIKIVGNISPCYILNEALFDRFVSGETIKYIAMIPKEFSFYMGFKFYVMFADYGASINVIANPIT